MLQIFFTFVTQAAANCSRKRVPTCSSNGQSVIAKTSFWLKIGPSWRYSFINPLFFWSKKEK